jgi:hypothetical protein
MWGRALSMKPTVRSENGMQDVRSTDSCRGAYHPRAYVQLVTPEAY